MGVTILLPTYNEEENIAKMIDSIRSISKKYKITVVDSNSTDNTQKIAKLMGAQVIAINKRGKGLAVKHALQRITEDYLIIMDSDLTYPVKKIPQFLELLKNFDVAIGSRFRGNIENGAMTPINKFGNIFLTMLASLTYGKNISDVCSGMWGFTKKAYKKISINAPHFELEVNLFVQCVKNGLRFCEIPIEYKKRGGKTKLRVSDGLRIAGYLVRRRF
ncbi:glycosyltransferase [Candidatus Micrarchaeota archaeon]|nr:glycosyltransferase [Candidatus Micrarchaeota archaeon]